MKDEKILEKGDIDQIKNGLWFTSLDHKVADALLGLAVGMNLPAGKVLFSRGDPGDGLYVVISGALRFGGGVSLAGTRESTLTLAKPPTWFGEVALLDGGPRTHDVRAEDPSRVAHVPKKEGLEKLLEDHPLFWRDLGRLAVAHLRIAFELLEQFQLDSELARLARHLVGLCEAYGQRRDRLHRVQITQVRLGQILGIARQTVSELVDQMEKAGVVKQLRGEVKILDHERLAGLAWPRPKT
jgi:CRP-like cAMP-binding protein